MGVAGVVGTTIIAVTAAVGCLALKQWLLHGIDGYTAKIRREARQRALDELEAVGSGVKIESGVGSDVLAAYWRAVGYYLKRREEQR